MEHKLSFKKDAFEYHMDCEHSLLQLSIRKSRAFIAKTRQNPFENVRESQEYDRQYNVLKVLELIDKLRAGLISIAQFEQEVYIDSVNLHE